MKEHIQEVLREFDSASKHLGYEVDTDSVRNLRDLFRKELQKAYESGKQDREDELTRNVLLEGEPRNYIGMDNADRGLSKKYEELLN